MNLFFTIFTAIISGTLGYLVLRRNERSATHVAFTVFCGSLALWAIANYFSITAETKSVILFWMRAVMAIAVLQSLSFFFFIQAFPNVAITLRKRFAVGLPILGLLTVIIAFSPLLFSDVTLNTEGGRSPVVAPGMLLFLITAVGSLFVAFIQLFRKYRRSSGKTRLQLRFILIGTFVMFFFILLFNLVFALVFKNSSFVNFAPVFVLPFAFAVFYSMTRHRLMDIRLVVKRTTVYFSTLITVLLIGLLLSWVERTFFKEAISPSFWGPVILLIGIVLFDPVKTLFEFIANKYFFTSLYNYQRTLEKLAKELTASINLDQIVDSIVKTIKDTMKLDRAGILLFEERTHNYEVRKTIGFTEDNGISLVRSNFLTKYLSDRRQPVIYQELESSQNDGNGEASEIGKLKANMKRIEASLCLPLILKDKLIGIIVLGQKISKDAYTNEDLRLLESLSNQAAVAIENARLYNTMEEIVDAQTKDIKTKNVQLERLLKAQSEFLDIASHQLRTPVSVIRGIVSMIQYGDMAKLPKAKQQQFIQSAAEKGAKLETIINDILSASELDSEKFKLGTAARSMHLEDVVDRAVEGFKLEAEQRDIDLQWLKPKVLPEIVGDAHMLEQAISNLISNALKYTPSTEMVKEARAKRDARGRVSVALKKESGNLVVSVSDNGIGIPKDEIPKLFKKFSRASNATAMYTDGSGLGLFIIMEIVEGHKGKTWVESEENKGSTFFISLPIAGMAK